MATGSSTSSLALPPDLLHEIQVEAEMEHRPAYELLKDIIERGLEDLRWQRLLAYGAERAKASGYTEEDIPRLIAESRAEQRQARE